MPGSSNDPVDVLIIGAGASGAAVAWSLAETRMHIVCMEQGDWTKPSEYPTNYADWEQRIAGPDHIDPNVRGRSTDYPVNNDESPISVVNFNGVGGGTILYAAHFPRLHPSDFRVRSLDGVADDWPVSYDVLEPYFAENDRMMGVSGLAGDPSYPPKQPPLPPLPLGRQGETVARGFNRLGWHWWPADSAIISRPYEGPRPVQEPRTLHLRLRPGREIEHGHHLLARGVASGRGTVDPLPRAGDHGERRRHGRRRRLLRRGGRGAPSAGRGGHPRLQRRGHPAHPLEQHFGAVPRKGLRTGAGRWAGT